MASEKVDYAYGSGVVAAGTAFGALVLATLPKGTDPMNAVWFLVCLSVGLTGVFIFFSTPIVHLAARHGYHLRFPVRFELRSPAWDGIAAAVPAPTLTTHPTGWWKDDNKPTELAQIEQQYPVLRPLVEHSRRGDRFFLLFDADPKGDAPLDTKKGFVAWIKEADSLLKAYPEGHEWKLSTTPIRPVDEVSTRVRMLRTTIAQIAERFDADGGQ